MTDEATFTAAQIGAGLGISTRRAQQLLASVPPSGVRLVSGNETASWALVDLPPGVAVRLADRARTLKFGTPLALLQAALKPWEPPAPLAQIGPKQIDEARKLRDAMEPFARAAMATSASISSLENDGLAAYTAAFGYRVSAGHWRRLLTRTLERASADGDVSRLEIYLPGEIRTRAPTPNPNDHRQFPTLAAEIERIAGGDLDIDARERIWGAAMLELENAQKEGMPRKRAQRLLIEFLVSHCPSLSRTRESLAKGFRDRWRAWARAGSSILSILDGRRGNGGRNKHPELSPDEKRLIQARTLNRRRRESQAWRELWLEGKLPSWVYKRVPLDWCDKSRMPQSVRDKITAEDNALAAIHQGGRAARNAEPSLITDRSEAWSGVNISFDDKTADSLTYLEDERGMPVCDERGTVILFRPQILGAHCPNSHYFCSGVVLPKPTYDSVNIVECVKSVHDQLGGLPARVTFEHGIWERSKLVAGNDSVTWDERIEGLRQIGIQISHANSLGAKSIERVWDQLQSRMDHWRGFVGREGRHDMPESTKRAIAAVRAGRAHPAEWFMSFSEFCAEFKKVVESYQDEPQKALDGLSPREAYVQRRGPPLIYFPASIQHLLKNCRQAFKVNKNGITILRKYRYFGPELAPLVGKRVLTWFDTTDRSLIVVTDFNGRNPVAVALVPNPKADHPGSEAMKQALARKAEHAAWGKTYYLNLRRNFPEEFEGQNRRAVWVDAETVHVGESIKAARAAKKAEQRSESLSAERLVRAARKLDYAVPANRRGEDADEAAEALRFLASRGIRATNPTHIE